MTKTESKYFIVTRKVFSTGKEYKVEYSADSLEEIQVIEADHIDELNKFGKDYETIKIDGPFAESTNDYLVLFKNKEIKAFLDTSKRNLDLMLEKLEKREGGVEEIQNCKSRKETADEVLRTANEIAVQTKEETDKVCSHILEQALLFNDKLLENRQGLTTSSINKIFIEVFDISKLFEVEVLNHTSKAADELERQSELARKVVRENEKRWVEQISEDGSPGLKLVLIERELKSRRAASVIAQSSKVAAGKLKAISEKAIANIHSKIQALIDFHFGV